MNNDIHRTYVNKLDRICLFFIFFLCIYSVQVVFFSFFFSAVHVEVLTGPNLGGFFFCIRSISTDKIIKLIHIEDKNLLIKIWHIYIWVSYSFHLQLVYDLAGGAKKLTIAWVEGLRSFTSGINKRKRGKNMREKSYTPKMREVWWWRHAELSDSYRLQGRQII